MDKTTGTTSIAPPPPPCSSQGQALWGKRKLWKVFSRDQDLSLSAVGRIKPKRRRRFRGHARRWQYGMRAKRLGELARIDRMSVGLPTGFAIKEFKAAGPVTGFVALKAYSRATSRCAKDFLAHPGSGTLVPPSWQWLGEAEASLPAIMPISEVSGLSHIMRLLRWRPEWNGCVERANAAVMSAARCKEDPLTATAINQELVHCQQPYNHCRPHDSLD